MQYILFSYILNSFNAVILYIVEIVSFQHNKGCFGERSSCNNQMIRSLSSLCLKDYTCTDCYLQWDAKLTRKKPQDTNFFHDVSIFKLIIMAQRSQEKKLGKKSILAGCEFCISGWVMTMDDGWWMRCLECYLACVPHQYITHTQISENNRIHGQQWGLQLRLEWVKTHWKAILIRIRVNYKLFMMIQYVYKWASITIFLDFVYLTHVSTYNKKSVNIWWKNRNITRLLREKKWLTLLKLI